MMVHLFRRGKKKNATRKEEGRKKQDILEKLIENVKVRNFEFSNFSLLIYELFGFQHRFSCLFIYSYLAIILRFISLIAMGEKKNGS